MTAPYAVGSATSAAAARAIAPQLDSLRRQVYNAVALSARGLTRDEAEVSLSLPHQTISPRIVELLDNGYLRLTGTTRDTRSGNAADVFVATDKDATVLRILLKETQRAFLKRVLGYLINGDTDEAIRALEDRHEMVSKRGSH